MDHYCLWLNNCIGYNNHRAFILTLIYLVLGCGYGVVILFPPFYDLIHDQVQTHGWRFLYEHGTGFLDLPTPVVMYHQIVYEGSMRYEIGVKLTFSILLTAGLILAGFLYTHIHYLLKGVTTLERMATLEFERDCTLTALSSRSKSNVNRDQSDATQLHFTIVNPFDQGIIGNVRQMMGTNILPNFVPFLRYEILPPFIPDKKAKDL